MEDRIKRLRISILVSPSAWGGMEIHTAELARTLASHGNEVSIVEVGSHLYGQGRFDPAEKIRIVSLADSRPLGNPGPRQSVQLVGQLSGDVLIFPKGDIYAGSWCLDFAARVRFAHYLTIEHKASLPMPPKTSRRHWGGFLPGIGLWWYKAKLDFFLRSLGPKLAIGVSGNVAKGLVEFHQFPARKVTHICNGIDSEQFRRRWECRVATRKKWGIPHDALVFGSIGRLHEWKGFDLGVKLFSELIASSRGSDKWLILVGDGPQRDALMELAEELGTKSRIQISGFSDRPWEIYPAFDVFLMPSLREGLPLSLLEAMACGCAPIAMGVGGIPEMITDPDLGWLIDPGDHRGFFAAMQEAAAVGPARLEEMGRNARRRITQHFEAKKQFAALAELIQRECG